jgi:hypothetical protein
MVNILSLDELVNGVVVKLQRNAIWRCCVVSMDDAKLMQQVALGIPIEYRIRVQ